MRHRQAPRRTASPRTGPTDIDDGTSGRVLNTCRERRVAIVASGMRPATGIVRREISWLENRQEGTTAWRIVEKSSASTMRRRENRYRAYSNIRVGGGPSRQGLRRAYWQKSAANRGRAMRISGGLLTPPSAKAMTPKPTSERRHKRRRRDSRGKASVGVTALKAPPKRQAARESAGGVNE